ncbi:MAG: tungstate transport system permease protein, partial [Parasphingorhabdus sp.]
MQEFTPSFSLALDLIFASDAQLSEIVGLSLYVSLSAVAWAVCIGFPLGALLGIAHFPGKAVVVVLVNALMGLPPVVVGLLVYLMLSNSGPLGSLQWLYTPTAMIIAQCVLITPIVTALTRETIDSLYEEYREQFRSFVLPVHVSIGALLWDARFNLLTVILAGFGRAVAEVGAVILVGGNINHVTRVMTTAIALETSRGELALALALGLILMLIALGVNA